MFGEYVPPERVAQMVESGERYSMAGESRELTVLFCDVREFTALSENLPPRDLSAMMNAYLTPMTSIIHYYHGTVDKYIGDSIMAFWGAPLPNENHARDGVDAALTMQEKIPALTKEFRNRGWPELAIGIGINSGSMNVGDMGSEFRKAYTVLGDAVNLASRLEGLTKEYGVPVIIGEDTRRAIPEMICRELDRVRVRGRALRRSSPGFYSVSRACAVLDKERRFATAALRKRAISNRPSSIISAEAERALRRGRSSLGRGASGAASHRDRRR